MADNPIPRPPPGGELKCDTTKEYHSDDTCFPVDHSASQEWGLSQIFGRHMKGTCPVADSGVDPVCLLVPDSRSVFVGGGVLEKKQGDGISRCYDIEPDANFEIILPALEAEAGRAETDVKGLVEVETPLLYAERSFTGYGQQHGGMQTILTNPSPDSDVEFVYMESLPWFMRVYLHTLEARIGGPSGKSDKSLIEEIYYRPALDRMRGTQLEVRMRIPPASTVLLTYDFEKSILRYTEYPPDANRGFDVAAAVITILSPRKANLGKWYGDASGARFVTSNLRTTSLLLSLPTPDFSMPYNVIIFTSTAIALAFGGMFNILVRRFVAADEGPEFSLGSIKEKLRARLKNLMRKSDASKADKKE